MKFIDLLSLCFNNLLRRKLRSGLTLLGIVLGAVSVSITLAIGSAIKSNNQKILDSKGNLKEVSVSLDSAMNRTKKEKDKLSLDDSAIKKLKEIYGVDGVWAELRIPSGIGLVAGNNNQYFSSGFLGVFLQDIEKFGLKLLTGKLPQQTTLENQKTVELVVGQYFEYNFKNERISNWKKAYRSQNSPVEKYEREKYNYDLDTFVFKPPFVQYGKDKMFLGIAKPKNKDSDSAEFVDLITGKSDEYSEVSSKTQFEDYKIKIAGRLDWEQVKDHNNWRIRDYANKAVLLDLSIAKELVTKYYRMRHEKIPDFKYSNVKVLVKDINWVEEVSNKIANLGFSPQNKISEVEKEQTRTNSNRLVLGVLGAITLFVAALSVASTMITSMYERIKEIGVMKVVGCKVGNVQILFLLESAVLGLLGGTVGMTITYFISEFMNNITNAEDITQLSGIAKLLSTYMSMMQYDSYATVKLDIALVDSMMWLYVIGGSLVVTLIAGYIPARRASKISALTSIKEE